VSFAWGAIHLVATLSTADAGSNDWTFGQIVPLVLLAAPFIAIIEYFYDGEASAQYLC
jgi:hypothetical protein